MRALVTGGAGFIGSALVRQLIAETDAHVLTLDKLTYAGRLDNLNAVVGIPRHRFERVDIADRAAVAEQVAAFDPDVVYHLAAESHVDRSIDSAAEFIQTNVVGTYTLLEVTHHHWSTMAEPRKEAFRFVHVSTDEVYGSLPPGLKFSEVSPYQPNSPYAATKASSDFLVRAWHKTFKYPALITNCSNNYGPHQYPEKLIPLVILNLLEGRSIPVYGDGGQIRDWLYVDDHVRALRTVAERGRLGETYCIGGEAESTNLELVHTLCDLFDEMRPEAPWHPHRSLIRHVQDRPGHDRRYATDISKIKVELDWAPLTSFADGLRRTVEWYLGNLDWCHRVGEGQDARARRGGAR
ncbi:MAG: dTDP-glucose 4,6-dehydratase [Alphaproteobacteria bacterium]